MTNEEQKGRHDKWRELIKEQEASGLSQTQFVKSEISHQGNWVIIAAFFIQKSRLKKDPLRRLPLSNH